MVTKQRVKTLSSITQILNSEKSKLFPKFGIKRLEIFGSYARGEQSLSSDLDVIVEFNKPIGIEFIDLGNQLEKLLKIKVELVSMAGIKRKYINVIKSEIRYI